MIRHEQTVEELLQSRLRPARLPAAEDAWRNVQGAVTRHAAGRRRQRMLVQLAAVLALSVAATTGLALAASPELREYLSDLYLRATLTGGQIKDGRLRSLYPAPTLTVLQPTELPEGLYLDGYGYNPGPVEIGPVGLPRPDRMHMASRLDGRDIPSDVVEAANRRWSELLADAHEPTLVLVYAATPERVVELLERPAAGRSLPSGEPTEIRGLPAVVARREGRDVVAWIEQGTLVEVHTTLGRAEALRVASGLEATPLVPFETTQAGQYILTPRPAPTSVPLAQRVEAVAVPRIDPDAVARRCGRWDAGLYPHSARQVYDQAFCVARVVAGVDEVRGGWGTSRNTWRVWAERLGLDPAVGPVGNPMVWSVQLEASREAGYVVILDAESGEPYLLVKLTPLP